MASLATQQIIWLIGASHGIGAAMAKKMAKRYGKDGTVVIASARDRQALEEMAACDAPHIVPIICDVTDNESLQCAYQEIMRRYGRVDMMVYCAGIYDPTSAHDFAAAASADSVLQMVDVNLHGAIRALHYVLGGMLRRETGRIVLIGSVAGFRGLPNAMGYGLSKAALIHLAENLRQDLDKTAIQVQIVNPGFVQTRLTNKNRFSMPFLMTADKAAHYIIRGIEKGRYEIHFPYRLSYMMKIFSLFPASCYFWLSRKLLG